MFYTTRPVEAGEELLWDYDPDVENIDFNNTICINGVKPYITPDPTKYVDVTDTRAKLKSSYKPVDARSFLRQ